MRRLRRHPLNNSVDSPSLMPPVLSKSTFVNAGLKCPLVLWATFNDRSLLPVVDASLQFIFDQGHEVGDLAKKLFPEAAEVSYDVDFSLLVKETKRLLKLGKPIFEASFQVPNALCRADVLLPVKNGYDLIEVKASNEVKGDHIWDVAFQLYVLEKAGIKVTNAFLMHLDREYVKKGPVDPKKLFLKENVTDKARELLPEIEPLLKSFVKIINGRRPMPVLKVDCTSPSSCPIHSERLPEVVQLFGSTGYKLLKQDITKAKDTPDSALDEEERRIKKATLTNEPFVDKTRLKKFLESLKHPLHCLDFETFSTAIPAFDKTSAWQQIPFQLSLHIIDKPGAKPRHVEYLSDDNGDPRKGIIDALRKIGKKGTILAYSMSFEKSVIEKLAVSFPKEKWLKKLLPRFRDLIEPFKQMMVYYPDQHGSNSLKATLPALTGRSYEDLELGDGSEASLQFYKIMIQNQPGDKQKLRRALLEYCGQDTEGMVEILAVLSLKAR